MPSNSSATLPDVIAFSGDKFVDSSGRIWHIPTGQPQPTVPSNQEPVQFVGTSFWDTSNLTARDLTPAEHDGLQRSLQEQQRTIIAHDASLQNWPTAHTRPHHNFARHHAWAGEQFGQYRAINPRIEQASKHRTAPKPLANASIDPILLRDSRADLYPNALAVWHLRQQIFDQALFAERQARKAVKTSSPVGLSPLGSSPSAKELSLLAMQSRLSRGEGAGLATHIDPADHQNAESPSSLPKQRIYVVKNGPRHLHNDGEGYLKGQV